MDGQQRRAAVDPLTGLRNRRAFTEQLSVEHARASRYTTPSSFLLLDVDRPDQAMYEAKRGGRNRVALSADVAFRLLPCTVAAAMS